MLLEDPSNANCQQRDRRRAAHSEISRGRVDVPAATTFDTTLPIMSGTASRARRPLLMECVNPDSPLLVVKAIAALSTP